LDLLDPRADILHLENLSTHPFLRASWEKSPGSASTGGTPLRKLAG
jgi:hypothetical protein